jgi:hypothetical protein
MNPPRKLTSQQRADEQQSLAQNQDARLQQPIHEFAGVEAMLRHDALHTPVPPTIAHRLQQSLGPVRSSAKPWWRRLFGS